MGSITLYAIKTKPTWFNRVRYYIRPNLSQAVHAELRLFAADNRQSKNRAFRIGNNLFQQDHKLFQINLRRSFCYLPI